MILTVNKIPGVIEFECGNCHALSNIKIASLVLGQKVGDHVLPDDVVLPPCAKCGTAYTIYRNWDEHPAEERGTPFDLQRRAVNAIAISLKSKGQTDPACKASHAAEVGSPPDVAVFPVQEIPHPESERVKGNASAASDKAGAEDAIKFAAKALADATEEAAKAAAALVAAQAAFDVFADLDSKIADAQKLLDAASKDEAAKVAALGDAQQAFVEARVVAKLAAVTDGADTDKAGEAADAAEVAIAPLAAAADAAIKVKQDLADLSVPLRAAVAVRARAEKALSAAQEKDADAKSTLKALQK